MPAYFDLNLQFLRKDLYPGFMTDFDAHLKRSGLWFQTGYWNGEGFTQTEIAAWNQQKLKADFELGDTEHDSHGYRQSLYEWGDFSHVRGFWMNRHPADKAFTWFLLIPEAEVLEYNLTFRTEAVQALAELAQKLWQFPAVRAIQTELELDGPPVAVKEIRKGIPPVAAPFAIVERGCHPYDDGSRVMELTQGRPGLLLLDEDLLDDLPGFTV